MARPADAADRLPPAGRLFPLPVPTRRGWRIGLDCIELPKARPGHDLTQAHIDLLTGRVPGAAKTAAAEAAARSPVSSGSAFRDAGLPDVPVGPRCALHGRHAPSQVTRRDSESSHAA